MPEVVADIDKMHRLVKLTVKNGKKQQNIIIRFKSHSSRYSVFNERKKAKHVKMGPNLTKRRGKLLYDAISMVEELGNVDFVFCDAHGDLKLRIKEPYNNKHFFTFETLDDLSKLLTETGCPE